MFRLSPVNRHADGWCERKKSMNILLLDDHGLVRAGFKALFQHLAPDVRIIEAACCDSAMEVLCTETVEIALVDIDLRGVCSGLDFLSLARESGYDMKIVMLSASDDRNTVLQCLSSGASGYIPKALDDQVVLKQAIEVVLQGGVYLPPTFFFDRPHAVWSSKEEGFELPTSRRLREVLYYVCQGLTNKGIARRMGIAEGTVRKNYVGELLAYFGVSRRTELIIEVARRKISLTPPGDA